MFIDIGGEENNGMMIFLIILHDHENLYYVEY